MRCSICGHANQYAIETALAASSVAEVAIQFGVKDNALERHITKQHPRAESPRPTPAGRKVATRAPAHAPRPEAGEDRSPDTVRSERVLTSARANIRRIATTIDDLLAEAKYAEGASYAEKASLARTALAANRQLAQLTGEIGVSEASVLASPIVQRLIGNLVEALKPYPDASKAILAVLEHRSVAA